MTFLSGFGRWKSGGTCIRGHVGNGLAVEEGHAAAARLCGLNVLATLRTDFGTLDGVERIVKVLGFVTSLPDFTGQPSIIDGLAVEIVCLPHRSHLRPHGRG